MFPAFQQGTPADAAEKAANSLERAALSLERAEGERRGPPPVPYRFADEAPGRDAHAERQAALDAARARVAERNARDAERQAALDTALGRRPGPSAAHTAPPAEGQPPAAPTYAALPVEGQGKAAPLDAQTRRETRQAESLPTPYKLLPQEGQGRSSEEGHARRQELLHEALTARRQELLTQAIERQTRQQQQAPGWIDPSQVRRSDLRNLPGEEQERQQRLTAVQRLEEDGRKSFMQHLKEGGERFYNRVFSAGNSIQAVLGEPGRFARAWGVDRASPNHMATLERSVDLVMARLARGLLPAIDGASAFLQRMADSGVVSGASQGMGATLSFVGGFWRSILNGLGAGAGSDGASSSGGLGDFIFGKPGEGPKSRSMAGLPTGGVGGSAEQYYDELLNAAVSMVPGSLEARLWQENMDAIKDLLGQLVENTSDNIGPAFR